MTGLLTLASFVAVVAGLYVAQQVLIPVTMAVLLSFVLAPLVALLRRLRIGRTPSVLLAVVLALSIVFSVGSVIGSQIGGLAEDLPRYEATVRQKLETVRIYTAARMSTVMHGVSEQLQPQSAAPKRQPGQPPAALQVQLQQPDPTPLQLAERILAPVIGPLGTVFIVFIVTLFVLMQREDLRDRLIRLLGSRDLHRTTVAMDDAAARLSRYFLFQIGINTGFGIVVACGLAALGVPSPVLFGITGALLRFVPYIGPVIAGALPAALAAAVDPGWSMVLWTVALFFVTEVVVGQVVEPMLYGRSTGLSPVSVVVAAIFWTWLWGPIGLILSTPLTLCLVVLGRHVDQLEFLDVLLGDRPALTPAENFYQRMLAGDPDEAHEQAELLLKDRSLTSYYDAVALKGLQMAAHDVDREVLNDQQLSRLREAVDALIEDLADHDDCDPHPAEVAELASPSRAERELPSQPAPPANAPDCLPSHWRAEAPLICIAGRGALDEPAARMLAQLLGKHGLPAIALPHWMASRAGIGELDPDGVGLACVVSLDVGGNTSHLRYTLRRLRLRLGPGVPILVGIWPEEDMVLRDDRLRAAVGADRYVSSLHDAVAACVVLAHDGGRNSSASAAA